MLTVASNPGHCLWSGIVPPDRAARVVERLMAPDMWSGWGIRTLSAQHPAFNPYSYQNGSVWPHDNGHDRARLQALRLRRRGGADRPRHQRGAASHFLLNQLPELYAGVQRGDTDFPVQYLGANVPQAWAAGSVFALLQAILGLRRTHRATTSIVDPASARVAARHDAASISVSAGTASTSASGAKASTRVRGAARHGPCRGASAL